MLEIKSAVTINPVTNLAMHIYSTPNPFIQVPKHFAIDPQNLSKLL